VICKAGLLWDGPLMFSRLIEDCGACCELVSPHMLASPFYRGRFVALVAPTGFGNPSYSRLLPALRASSPRIRRFVENGGNLLIFGAGDDRPNAYDWLPFPVTYHQQYKACSVEFEHESTYASIVADWGTESVECDGFFSDFDADPVAVSGNGDAVMLKRSVGEGTVIITSIHEYPSRQFLRMFSCGARETLF
jgi:hypothetical protein